MNVNLTWKDPSAREDGTPLDISELAGIEILMKASGAPDYTSLGVVSPGVQTKIITDLPPGDYLFAAQSIDMQTPAKFGALVETQVTIPVPAKAAPGAVTNFAASLS